MPEQTQTQAKPNGNTVNEVVSALPLEEKKYVFFDITVENIKYGRIVIELLWESAPKTCANFWSLCSGLATGAKGLISYKDSVFFSVQPVLVQGGDVVNNDGSGGESIYGSTFEDESFEVVLKEGVVAMVNDGKDTNNSQFFICTDSCEHLQGLNVGFGTIRKGYGIVKEFSKLPHVDYTPIKQIKIANCGTLSSESEEWNYCENDGLDQYPSCPEDFEPNEEVSSGKWRDIVINAINDIKNQGNHYYSEKQYAIAERKYAKGLHYLAWLKVTNVSAYDECECASLESCLLLNLASINLRCENFRQAEEQCSQALNINETAKAYKRRGQAKLCMHNYEAALTDLNQAQKLDPSDKEILKDITKVLRTKQKTTNEEREIYKNMFKGFESN